MRSHIPALTGIRGVAALLVMLFHLPLDNMFALERGLPIVRNGNLGVDLFFILSGFILMHVHASDFERLNARSINAFFVTRFFRVYPLHILMLIGTLFFVLLAPGYVDWFRTLGGQQDAYSWAGFIQTLTLTNSIGLPDLGTWNPPSWSLSAEAVGYAMFPILAFASGRIRKVYACHCAAVVLLCVYCVNRNSIDLGGALARMGLCFTAGIALARAYHLRPNGPARGLAIFSAILSGVALWVDDWANYSVFGFAGLIYALAMGGGTIEKLLSSAPAMFLGKISFSLYMSHFVLQGGLLWAFWGGDGTTSRPVLASLILLTATFIVAFVIYHVVERPSHRLGRKLARRVPAENQVMASPA